MVRQIKKNPSRRHVVLDVETTGLSARDGDRIIEIGAVAIEGQAVIDEFCSLIQVDRRISEGARQVHGITHEMLRDQPRAEELLPEFHQFIRDSFLVAHNANFDIGFLRHEFLRLRLPFSHPYFCTLELSRLHFPRLRDHKLETVFRHLFGEPATGKQRHRALDDARMVARIWMEMRGR